MRGNAPLNAFPKDYGALLNELTTVMQDLGETSARKAAIAARWNFLYRSLFPTGVVDQQAIMHESDIYRFYTSGKRDLELINKILHDPNVHLETRRRAAINLADEIEHSCLAGMIGYIRIVAASLEACAGGLIGRLYAARVSIMNQVFAVAQSEQSRRNGYGVGANVHVNSALFNHFADRYHVARIEESYGNNQALDSRGLNLHALQQQLDQLLEPTALIRHLAEDCLNSVNRAFGDVFPGTALNVWRAPTEYSRIQPALNEISLAHGGMDEKRGGIPVTALIEFQEEGEFRAGTNVPLVQHHISMALERQSLLLHSRPLVDSPLDPDDNIPLRLEYRDTGMWCMEHYSEPARLDAAHLRDFHPEIIENMPEVWALQSTDPAHMATIPPSRLNHSHVIAHFLKVMGPQRAVQYLQQHRNDLPHVFTVPRHTWLLAAWLMPGARGSERLAMISALLGAGVAPAFPALGRARFLPRLFISAIQHQAPDILAHISASGITMDELSFQRGLLPLQEAARGRNAKIFSDVLAASPARAVLATDDFRKTPLYYASSRGNSAFVQQMLDKLLAEPATARTARGLIAECLVVALRHQQPIVGRLLAEHCPDLVTLRGLGLTASSLLMRRLHIKYHGAVSSRGVSPKVLSNSGIRALGVMLTPPEFQRYVKVHHRAFDKLIGPSHADEMTRRINSIRWVTAIRGDRPEASAPYWSTLRDAGASLRALSSQERRLVVAYRNTSRNQPVGGESASIPKRADGEASRVNAPARGTPVPRLTLGPRMHDGLHLRPAARSRDDR